MIKFGSNDKVENIGILEKEEVEAYVEFLEAETGRHKLAIYDADYAILNVKNKLTIPFWQSAALRHKKDISEIDALISTVKGFYGI